MLVFDVNRRMRTIWIHRRNFATTSVAGPTPEQQKDTSSSTAEKSAATDANADGLAAYPKQALRVLRERLRTGNPGYPRLLLPEGVMVAQTIKRHARRRVIGVLRRIVRGTEAEV